MDKGQFESGCSSAATHRLTQASTTLNRRYVQRPTNLAIEEAAQNIAVSAPTTSSNSAPSRLVNLGVHRAELEAALAAPEIPPVTSDATYESEAAIIPNVYEFGQEALPETPIATPSTNDLDTNYNTLDTSDSYSQNPQYSPTYAPEYYYDNTTMPAAEPMDAPQPEIDTAALAMSIAADYAAANLGASVAEYGEHYQDYAMAEPQTPVDLASAQTDSVEAIAQAASQAIASIRNATEPDEVAEQVASLKTFADSIKANDAPEMRELSDTIDKFVKIAMKSTGVKEAIVKKAAAPTVSLSSKATRAANKVTKSSAKIIATNRKASTTRPIANNVRRPNSAPRTPNNLSARRRVSRPASSEELKERAIQQALRSVATMDEPTRERTAPRAALHRRKKSHTKRFLIAFTCAAACVAAIVYFVGTNMPDISVRVAAMQTGMQASYPAYIPRDYSLSDTLSEDGKITMIFTGPGNASFTLIEEKSSWDSAALLRNFVEEEWGEDYTTTHEQGITIYTSNSDAAWVNGGILYKIISTNNSLTKKQLRNIVVSI